MTETRLKKPGDRISLDSRRAGGHSRSGEIVEVLGEREHTHYRVRWDDGDESYFYPAAPSERAARPTPPAERRRRSRPAGRERRLRAAAGDRLVIHGHRQGEPERDAEILEVRGADGGPPFLVRWEDSGTETLLYPGSDAHVEHFPRRRRASQAQA